MAHKAKLVTDKDISLFHYIRNFVNTIRIFVKTSIVNIKPKQQIFLILHFVANKHIVMQRKSLSILLF